MKKLYCIMCACLLFSMSALAWQPPDTLWSKVYSSSYDETVHNMTRTSDGGVMLCAAQHTGGIGYNWIIQRVDSNGVQEWRELRDWGNDDMPFDVISTTQGDFALCGGRDTGSTWRYGTFVRISGTGTFLREEFYEPASMRLHGIVQTPDGGFVMVGTQGSAGAGSFNAIVVSTDYNGNNEQFRYYGGPLDDSFNKVVQLSSNSLLMVGHYALTPDSVAAVMMKTNLQGDEIWTRLDDRIELKYASAQNTLRNSVVVTGFIELPGHQRDVYFAELDSLGDLIWERTYGTEDREVGLDAQPTADGGFVLTVSTENELDSDILLLRTNANGDSIWSRRFGTPRAESGGYVEVMDDKSYMLSLTQEQPDGRYAITMYRTTPDLAIWIQYPNGGEDFMIHSQDTVRWRNLAFSDTVKIELNRNYPSGTWELMADSVLNDGEEVVTFSGPPSNNCRIRVSAVDDSSLTDISDADFSISASSGYLGLVRTTQPNVVVLSWDAGTVECPAASSEWFHVKNFGPELIVWLRPPDPASAAFSSLTDCGTFQHLLPDEMSACSLQLVFDPDYDGEFFDSLRIPSSAGNAVGDTVRIALVGSQITTPEAPQVVLASAGFDVTLMWNPVTESIGDCPITPTRYLVFFSEREEGPYWYHGFTADTSYLHAGAVYYAQTTYYHVYTTTAMPELLATIPFMKEESEVALTIAAQEH